MKSRTVNIIILIVITALMVLISVIISPYNYQYDLSAPLIDDDAVDVLKVFWMLSLTVTASLTVFQALRKNRFFIAYLAAAAISAAHLATLFFL